MKRKEDVLQAGLKFMDRIVGEGKDPPSFLRMDRAAKNEKMVVLIKKKHSKVKTECM